MSKRVRTLLRVSSRQQLHDDDIPMQRAENQQFIAKQKDWVFDREYIEKAVSAYKNHVEDRKILQDILQDARRKEFDILLCYMSDRIGRKEEYSTYVATLNALGIEVWTIKDGQLKTEEHIDKLMNFIRFWQNEGESKKTGMRVRDAQKEMVQSGKFVGGCAPYGYRLVLSGELSNHGRALHKLEIVEEQAVVIRKIYSLAIHKGYGAEKIAKTLNSAGIKAPIADNWKGSTVSSILKNPVYMGYLAYCRRVNHGSFTRLDRRDWIYAGEQNQDITIVSPVDWERAQELREARKAQLAKSQARAQHILQQAASEEGEYTPFSTSGKLALIGLVYCGYCGKKLKNSSYNNKWFNKKTGEERISFCGRYSCPNKCRERSSYAQNYLEPVVFEVLGEYLSGLKNINMAEAIQSLQRQQELQLEREMQSLDRKIRELNVNIDVLNEHIPKALQGDSVFSAEKLAEQLRRNEEKLEELERERVLRQQESRQNSILGLEADNFVLEKSMATMPDWKAIFDTADTAAKRMLLAAVIDRIEVGNNEMNIRFRIGGEDLVPENYTSPYHSVYTLFNVKD